MATRKNVFWSLCVLGFALFTAGAAAQERPPYGAAITLDQAKKISAGAVAESAKNGWRMAIAIVDNHGFLVYYERPFCLLSWVPHEVAPAAIARGMLHLAACLAARIDGKSRVDYLPEVRQQEAVRKLARELFAARPADWNAARPIIERAIASIS